MLADRTASHQRELATLTAAHQRETETLRAEHSRKAERQRVALKKSEVMFLKELEAASAFVAMRRQMEPRLAHPEMDWYEALETIAADLEQHEKTLEAFLRLHGAVLAPPARDSIEGCLSNAAQGKFAVEDDRVTEEGTKYAERFHGGLKAAETAMLDAIRKQTEG